MRTQFVKKNWFLLIAGMVPALLFLNRFLLPDVSFDVINYHLFLGQRGFFNVLLPMQPHEFFPVGGGSFATLFDVPFFVWRSLLGYRLGTSLGLLAYWVIIYLIYKIITLLDDTYFVRHKLIGPLLFLNATVVLELYFEVATYYVEIVTTACILLIIYLYLKAAKQPRLDRTFFGQIGLANFFTAIAIIGKLTNFFYAIPLLVFFAYLVYRQRDRITQWVVVYRWIAIDLLVLLGPILLYYNAIFLQTGNPVFPLYNHIFLSPYFINQNYNFAAIGIGPQSFWQKLLWPIIGLWHARQLGEIESLFYDGKLFVVGFVVFVLGMIAWRKKWHDARFWFLWGFWLSTYIFWSFTTGYVRFATVTEIAGSILFCLLLPRLFRYRFGKVLCLVLCLFLLVQNIRLLDFNLHYDYSWRPPLWQNQLLHRSQVKHLFANTIPTQNFNPDITVNCTVPNSGYISLTPFINRPMILIDTSRLEWQYLSSPKYSQKANAEITQTIKKPTLTYITIAATKGLDPTYNDCLITLLQHHFTIDRITQLSNFLGYQNQAIALITGHVKASDL